VSIAPELLHGLIERAARPDFGAFEAQLRSSGNCARPVRLQGTIETCDGHGQRRVWSTDTEPDGVLRKACGNRREAVCPPCAERYRQDAYHLIAAGLRGGKGVPDTVAGHPAVFFTLTAPSFGAVHNRPLGPGGEPRRCRPRRDAPTCEHGVRVSCNALHDEGDPCLGEPLCPQCFDYTGAIVWNNRVGELWRRTGSIYLPRILARRVEITQTHLHELVRVAYVKVAEYQQRGLVHLHVLARLDRAMPDYRADQLRPPDARFTTELLEDAVRETVAEVSAPIPDALGGGRIQWGEQLEVRPLSPTERREVAGYLAKYATKSTEQAGGLLHRIDPEHVDRAPVREHVRRYLRSAFELNTTAAKHRARARPRGGAPRIKVETDWNVSALALRAGHAISHGEPVRIRLRDDTTAHLGRAKRITASGPARNGTTITIMLDSGERVHLGDVASIGPAQRPARRPDRNDPRLAACAHAFGYRGHCLTKSRRYSTMFKALREAREAYVHEQILARSRDAAQRAIAEAMANERIASFHYVGQGHVTAADAYLAASAAARARERRRIGREECCGDPKTAIRARRRATGEPPVGEGESDREAVQDG
jgi:hypothetical protein